MRRRPVRDRDAEASVLGVPALGCDGVGGQLSRRQGIAGRLQDRLASVEQVGPTHGTHDAVVGLGGPVGHGLGVEHRHHGGDVEEIRSGVRQPSRHGFHVGLDLGTLGAQGDEDEGVGHPAMLSIPSDLRPIALGEFAA